MSLKDVIQNTLDLIPKELFDVTFYDSIFCGHLMDLVLLSMELSGNLIQYDLVSFVGWSITPVFHVLPSWK